MIGIICAMHEEIDEILLFMENRYEEKYGYVNFIRGTIFGIECVATKCGIGKVHAAICTQTLIMNYNPDLILNVGVAGGIHENLKIGDIVVANNVIQHDFDVSAFQGRRKGEISGLDLVEIPTSKWISERIIKHSDNVKPASVYCGTILSGDQFISSKEKLQQLESAFGGLACEMEAGSIGQVCYINKKDFGIIRAISDGANENSKTDIERFVKTSSKNAALLVTNFIKSYQD